MSTTYTSLHTNTEMLKFLPYFSKWLSLKAYCYTDFSVLKVLNLLKLLLIRICNSSDVLLWNRLKACVITKTLFR